MATTNKLKLPSGITMALMFGASSVPTIALADLVCHIPENNAIKLLNVSAKAVKAHLRHGDYLPYLLYADVDGDGFGDPDTLIPNCLIGPGSYVDNGDDLDDTDYEIGDDEPEEEGETSD